MELDFPFGPWKRVVFGNWGEYPTGIYSNPDRLILLAVFERDEAGVKGVLTMLAKAFVTDADLSKAARAQKREVTIIEKHSVESSRRYAIVSTAPIYSPYSQKAIVDAINRQAGEVKVIAKSVEELAEAYGSKAKDLAVASDEEANALLGDPFLIMALVNPRAPPTKESLSTTVVHVGASGAGEPVSVPLQSLATAVVAGGSREQRLAAVQVLCEDALANSVPVVIIDSSNSFAGLASPNRLTRDFTKFKMTAMPLGFPYRDYRLGSGFYVDLAGLDAKTFTKCLGLSQTSPGDAIEAAWRPDAHAISDLIEQIEAHGTASKEPSAAYDAAKAKRAIRVAEKTLQGIFAKFVEGELLAPWQEGIGRAFHLDASGYGDAGQNLAIASLLNAVKPPKGKRLRAVVAFEADLAVVQDEVLELINSMRGNGLGFILHAEHELDAQLIPNAELKLELIKNEIVATVVGQKPARFFLRPTYTDAPYARQEPQPQIARRPAPTQTTG